jgi:hypothetical protein
MDGNRNAGGRERVPSLEGVQTASGSESRVAAPSASVARRRAHCQKKSGSIGFNQWRLLHQFQQAPGLSVFSYQNHYQPRLNKCFLLVLRRIYFKSNKGDTYLRELELYDVNENNRYGGYIGRAPKGSSDSSAGQKDVICEMRGKACSSEQEWWELSNRYMEDD